jgi:hypothetical protein
MKMLLATIIATAALAVVLLLADIVGPLWTAVYGFGAVIAWCESRARE